MKFNVKFSHQECTVMQMALHILTKALQDEKDNPENYWAYQQMLRSAENASAKIKAASGAEYIEE